MSGVVQLPFEVHRRPTFAAKGRLMSIGERFSMSSHDRIGD